MINHLPDRLDLYAAAEAGRELRGRLKLDRLVRALPLFESTEGELEVVLELGRDEDGIHYLDGSVQGSLLLLCQRCLEPMEYPLAATFRLGLVHSPEHMRGHPQGGGRDRRAGEHRGDHHGRGIAGLADRAPA